MVRWNRFRQISESTANARARIVEATVWKAVAGAMWGLLAVFSNLYLPDSLDFFTAIAVAAVAVGSVSTMAAIPAAVYAFITLSFAPFIVLWLAGGTTASVTLGLLAILLLGVILNSARVAYSQLMSILKAEFDHKQLSGEFEAARGEWLELSDTTEAYIVFDQQERLLSWNEPFAKLLKVPPELLHRGTPRAALIKGSRRPADVASHKFSIEQWINLRTDSKNDETGVSEYEGGVWIQRRQRYNKNGQLVVSHVDITEIVKTEAALLESEQRYRSITESSPGPIFVRVEDEIVYANPAAVKLLRAQDETDLLGSAMLELYHPGDRNIVMRNRAILAQNRDEQPPSVRLRMRRVDGTYVMTEGSGINHIWQGQPAVLTMRRDITAQIDADERLQESERRYRSIADLSPVAILVRVEDRIVYANPAAVQLHGAESEVDLLYESTVSFTHPDDRHLVYKNRARMSDDMKGAAPTIKVRLRRFDGTHAFVEGSGAPFVWQGQPAVMLMLRDISAETEADRQIHKNDEQLRAIVENMPGSIVLKDTNLRIRLAAGRNYSQWAGVSGADAVGKTAADLVPKDLADELERRDREVLDSGEVADVEINAKTADGQNRTFLSTHFPVNDDSGATIGVGIINQDVTDQRKVEEQLRRKLETADGD